MSNDTPELSVTDQLISLISKMSRNEMSELLEELIKSLSGDEQRIILTDLLTRSMQREHVRHHVFSSIKFTVDEKTHDGVIENISLSGLFIETSKSFAKGSEVTMEIPFYKSDRLIKVTGVIVRITEHGIGIKFYK